MNNPTYCSIFKTEFQDLVEVKKALGFSYDAEAASFQRIDMFFVQNHLTVKMISWELCDEWCKKRSYENELYPLLCSQQIC
ncbi:hypothetical protein Ana3638_08625 [Anaerocolumna sedimenticola]|uniref:Uncharacterized protein n=1 Tax=Anaerocolumna sedimenticola TaxID=2696063 RepID=A0A6P1TL30_9FIRM|nr:hypothetical protein [Anaerocolumna sedimenticola]QHQ60822.1 hypothetical protein Ana3638_08625 [Anaerocolumna sedimenticola]